ncbi:MAG: hypothetical protein V1731_03500, partial [Candidatus Aenigmatarchaeota archaeon]
MAYKPSSVIVDQQYVKPIRDKIALASASLQAGGDHVANVGNACKYLFQARLKLNTLDRDSPTYVLFDREANILADKVREYAKDAIKGFAGRAANEVESIRTKVSYEQKKFPLGVSSTLRVNDSEFDKARRTVGAANEYTQDVLSRTTKFRISDNDLKRYANSSLEELRKTKTDLQKYERSHHGWIV